MTDSITDKLASVTCEDVARDVLVVLADPTNVAPLKLAYLYNLAKQALENASR